MKRRAGYALLSVLLGLVVIALITNRLGLLMRADVTEARHRLVGVQQSHLMDQILLTAIEGLMEGRGRGFWRVDGSRFLVKTDRGDYRITISDEMGRMSAGKTGEADLVTLFQRLGVPGAAQAKLLTLMRQSKPGDMGWVAQLEFHLDLPSEVVIALKDSLSVVSERHRPNLANSSRTIQDIYEYQRGGQDGVPGGSSTSQDTSFGLITMVEKGRGHRLSSEATARIVIEKVVGAQGLGGQDITVVRLTGPKQVPFQILARY